MKTDKEVSYHTLRFMAKLTDILRPKPPLSISEWADQYMVLPEGSNESGHYSSDTIPYQKGIMDAITDPEVVDVAVMSSSQVGKTTIIMCGIGYYIDYEPSTQMLVMPTINDGERFSKTRLAQMIEDIPQLKDKVASAKAKDSNNTILLKSYPGGTIAIAGANSPSSLASDPRRIIWMDETDRFPESAGSEGNPIKLAEKRATSYWNKKHIKTSTPTIKGRSKIEDAYMKGSQEEWCVKCPECGEWQPYDFKRVSFEEVAMACKGCGTLIPEQKWKECEHRWIAKHPERKKARSFKLNEMASPFVDWIDIINNFKDANDKLQRFHDPQDLKVFVNTVLGETWEDKAIDEGVVDEEKLNDRSERYGTELPEGVLILTAAIDVQDDRFEVEIRGWARDFESWGIYKTEIYGDLITAAPWEALEDYLAQIFHFADGRELGIAGFAIDTGGHYTNDVYRWAKKQKQKKKKCFAVKGYAGKPDIPIDYKKTVVQIKEERGGKLVPVDVTILNVIGVDSGKEDIMKRLEITEPGPGYCHFPSEEGRGYDDKYFEGLLSEHKIMKKVGGVYKKVWVKKAGVVRNEPLDLMNYNYATLCLLRPEFDVLEKKLEKGINYMQPQKKQRKAYKAYQGLEV